LTKAHADSHAPERGVVLLYHSVCELEFDPYLLAIRPARFAEHLELLSRRWRPISLREAVEEMNGGGLPERAVVVTFDDGYADNLHAAKPLLERYGVPATVYVTTGYLGGEREFWWDELVRILLSPGSVPEVLALGVNGTEHEWELGTAASYSIEDHARHRSWSTWEDAAADPTPRHRLLRSLHALLRVLSPAELDRCLDSVRRWAGCAPARRVTQPPLTDDELCRLADGDAIEIGAHTVSHAALSSCTPAEQEAEITVSRTRLEEILGRPVPSFSYPFGQRSDYGTEAVALVRRLGFEMACSAVPGAITRATDPYEIPRMMSLGGWEAGELDRQLELATGRRN
jgi:peptidoglycan/xylan/chitin deacetylase (PgdA/CDA1 family)